MHMIVTTLQEEAHRTRAYGIWIKHIQIKWHVHTIVHEWQWFMLWIQTYISLSQFEKLFECLRFLHICYCLFPFFLNVGFNDTASLLFYQLFFSTCESIIVYVCKLCLYKLFCYFTLYVSMNWLSCYIWFLCVRFSAATVWVLPWLVISPFSVDVVSLTLNFMKQSEIIWKPISFSLYLINFS